MSSGRAGSRSEKGERTAAQVEASWRALLSQGKAWPFPVPAGAVDGDRLPVGVSCRLCGETERFGLFKGCWMCLACRPDCKAVVPGG